MAAGLAVLLSNDIEHGPIEALFTVDEETGLTGAMNLGKGMISGKYLLNLDSEEDGEICVAAPVVSTPLAHSPMSRLRLPRNFTM